MHITLCLLVSMGLGKLLTLVLSSSGSVSEHQPMQWLQTLQFYSMQDCGKEYSRISANSENQWPICTIGSRDTAGGQGPRNRHRKFMESADSAVQSQL